MCQLTLRGAAGQTPVLPWSSPGELRPEQGALGGRFPGTNRHLQTVSWSGRAACILQPYGWLWWSNVSGCRCVHKMAHTSHSYCDFYKRLVTCVSWGTKCGPVVAHHVYIFVFAYVLQGGCAGDSSQSWDPMLKQLGLGLETVWRATRWRGWH